MSSRQKTSLGGSANVAARHWSEDPRLNEVDSDGASMVPVVESVQYGRVGSWEDERAQLVGVIRYLVLEVHDLFERVAEHDEDLFHGRT